MRPGRTVTLSGTAFGLLSVSGGGITAMRISAVPVAPNSEVVHLVAEGVGARDAGGGRIDDVVGPLLLDAAEGGSCGQSAAAGWSRRRGRCAAGEVDADRAACEHARADRHRLRVAVALLVERGHREHHARGGALAVAVEHPVVGPVLPGLRGRLEAHAVVVDEGDAARGFCDQLVGQEHPRVVWVVVVVEHVDRDDVAGANGDEVGSFATGTAGAW